MALAPGALPDLFNFERLQPVVQGGSDLFAVHLLDAGQRHFRDAAGQRFIVGCQGMQDRAGVGRCELFDDLVDVSFAGHASLPL